MRRPRGVPYGAGGWCVVELSYAVIVARRATEHAAQMALLSWQHKHPGRRFVLRQHA